MNQDDINRKRVADLTCLSKDATELAYYDHAIDKTKIRYYKTFRHYGVKKKGQIKHALLSSDSCKSFIPVSLA